MANKRIFDINTIASIEDIDEHTWIWIDKKAPEGEPALPSWKVRGDIFLKVLNNFATHFVPNVLTVVGKCYWYGGDLYECNTAYSGAWVPANFTATSIDELFARKDVLSELQTNVTTLTTYAQNVAASIAPPFDPTRDSEHAYPAGYSVTYTDGKVYTFTAPHYGAWNAADVVVAPSASSKLDYFVVSSNAEYPYMVTDKNGIFIFGIRKDGSVTWQKGIPVHVKTFVETKVKELKDFTDNSLSSLTDALTTGLAGKVDKVTGKSLVDENFASQLSATSNGEYLYCIVDSQNRVVAGVRKDGSFAWQKGIPSHVKVYVESAINNLSVSVDYKLAEKVDKVTSKSLVETVHADSLGNLANNEFLYAVIDSGGHVLVALRTDGSVNFFGNVHFAGEMKLGDDAMESLFRRMNSARFIGDYTERKEAKIAEPTFAFVNILGTVFLPGSKGNEIKAWMEFFDGNGNYFKKRIIMDGQGNSTLEYPKHNIAVDICNDEWIGDDTFKVAFGTWPAQDSFHIKAFWVDPFSGAISVGLYDYLDKIWMDRGFENDAPWKKALVKQRMHGYEMKAVKDYDLRIDTGGRNHPQAFPCALYVNGKFHGIYAFSEKKSREVYHEKKDNKNNIHLDGEMGRFWYGEIDWTTFEVRVPKSLICMDGSKYDGDAPLELIDTTSPSYNASNSKHVLSKDVKQRVINASEIMTTLDAIVTEYGADSDEFKEAFSQYFDLDNLIDYVIFCETTLNTDSGVNNVQWVTYDGVKWWACPYDLDRCLGNWYGYFNRTMPGHLAIRNSVPTKYIGSCPTFLAALETRYAELRNKGIVSVDSIFEVVHKWVQRCGYDMIKADWDRWPQKPCNMDTVVNSDYWEMVLVDGEPVYGTYNYSGDVEYSVGDEVFYGRRWASGGSELNDCVKFRCVAPTTGNAPCINVYSRDSEWRIYEFLKWWIPEMDSRYNYTPNN